MLNIQREQDKVSAFRDMKVIIYRTRRKEKKPRSERSSALGKVTQLVIGRTRVLIWVFLMLMLMLSLPCQAALYVRPRNLDFALKAIGDQ